MAIIRTIVYSIKQSIRQIIRNKPMLMTSLFSITAMMLILGLFFVFAVNIGLLTKSARDQFDMVEVFLSDSVDEGRLERLESIASRPPYVEKVKYISKDDALLIMKKRWGEHGYLLDGLSGNPLPASLQVTLNDISRAGEFVGYMEGRSGVEDVSCRQDEIRKITGITQHIQIGAVIVIFFLIIISVVVVINTVKLTVMARGREIRIMRYVGATNWFIRGPFLTEGILMGIIASVFSSLIVFCLYYSFLNKYSEKILIMFSAQMMPVQELMRTLTLIFFVIGIVIGSVGSLISMRRYLKM